MTPNEERMLQKLAALHKRINEIAGLEARAALVGGWAAQGHMMEEKERLIDESTRILDQLIDWSGT